MKKSIVVYLVCFLFIVTGATLVALSQLMKKDIKSFEAQAVTLIEECRKENERLRDKLHQLRKRFSLTLTATAYSVSRDECNHDLNNTATMETPKPGLHVAVSHDLLWMLGKKVYVEGLGIRKVADLMNKRHKKCIDIMMPSKKMAKNFGKKKLKVVVLE